MSAPPNPFTKNLPDSKQYYSAKEKEELIFDLAEPFPTKDRDRPFDTRYGQFHRGELPGDVDATTVKGRILQSAKLSAEHMGHLSDLDLIASSILALVHSSGSIEAMKTQLKSNLKTVAVALNSKTLYVTHNGLLFGNLVKDTGIHERDVTGEDRRFVLNTDNAPLTQGNFKTTGQGNKKKVTFSPERAIQDFFEDDPVFGSMVSAVKLLDLGLSASKHAEVGLLESFMTELNSTPEAIGVSKPCCQACGRILMAFDVHFTCVHNIDAKLLTHYELPEIPEGKAKTAEWKEILRKLKE